MQNSVTEYFFTVFLNGKTSLLFDLAEKSTPTLMESCILIKQIRFGWIAFNIYEQIISFYGKCHENTFFQCAF